MGNYYDDDERDRSPILLRPMATEPEVTAAPAPLPEADAPTDIAHPDLAPIVAGLRASKCTHGVLAECPEHLIQLFVPRSFMLAKIIAELVTGWPDHCDDCDEPTLATHATPEDADGDVETYCEAHAKDHPAAAPVHCANALTAAGKMVGLGPR